MHMHAIQRSTAIFIGVVLTGMLGALAARWLILPTGAPAPGLFEVQASSGALVMVMLIFAAGAALAAVVGRLTNAAVGLFVLGAGMFVMARRGGSVVELAFSGGGLGLVVVETLIWAGLILVATLIVFRISGPLRDIEPDQSGRVPNPFTSREAMISAAMGGLVLPVVWLVAQSPEKGQALGAAILGATAAGLAGRLISPHVQPMLLFASPCVFGGIGHVIGLMMMRGGAEHAVVTNAVSAFNVPMPLDYAAGSLIGVALGLGWARSMLHHEEHDSAEQAANRA